MTMSLSVYFQFLMKRITVTASFGYRLKPLSHQGGVLTVIPRRPKKMQNAAVRAVRTQASPQQRSGIAIGRGGIA